MSKYTCFIVVFDRPIQFIVFVGARHFYVMAFFGPTILRRRNPNAKRDFSIPLYPITPLIAIGGSLFVLISEVMSDWQGVLISFIFVLIGIPVYYYQVKKHPTKSE